MFVTIEGIEGGGKTTQVGRLAEALRGVGHRVIVTREPGGTALGRAVRELLLHREVVAGPLSELFLVLADRAEHVASVIRPALARGEIVLCDRFSDSTIAYQAFGRELALDAVRAAEEIARQGLAPDLTFLLDCPVEVGLARTERRRGGGAADRFEGEAFAFHDRVRAGFLALAREHPERIHMLDTRRPIDEVHGEIRDATLAALRGDQR